MFLASLLFRFIHHWPTVRAIDFLHHDSYIVSFFLKPIAWAEFPKATRAMIFFEYFADLSIFSMFSG